MAPASPAAPRHYTFEDLDWEDLGKGWTRASVSLHPGDTAVNPASTKGPIYGPATVTYERAPGGITTYVD